MTFTKTSQKFGQWSDPRANTVYGLGFASETELLKVWNGVLHVLHRMALGRAVARIFQ